MTQPTYPVAQDTWGALSIPAQPGYSFTPIAQSLWVAPARIPVADPCLAVILDYLATAINTDQLIQAAWDPIKSLAKSAVLSRIFPQAPGDVGFNVSHLPALYAWRESGKNTWEADEWNVKVDRVMMLWVFPLGTQELQMLRDPIVNALIDGIENAVERGRTPSWVQPGDTDPRASYEGSVFYPYAGFESFTYQTWKRSKLLIQSNAKDVVDAYPAIEITWELKENQIRGTSRFFVSAGDQVTLYDASASTAWAANTTYALNAQVFPTGGNGFVYTCTTAGETANTPPDWPTTIGQTVQDGSAVWTCTAAMAPNGNVTDSGPLG